MRQRVHRGQPAFGVHEAVSRNSKFISNIELKCSHEFDEKGDVLVEKLK